MSPSSTWFGLLNVHKPSGKTSRDVVNQVQKSLRGTKVGHAGTLDPLASGVLVLCLGPATRLIEYVQRQPKQYMGTFLLGRTSPTEDIEGEVSELPQPPIPTAEEIEALLPEFHGEILQRPPAYSALKVQGKRAYDLARSGADVELAARPVQIYGLELLEYEYPEIKLRIECGSGTYVRSLGRDLAERLGSTAVMSALVRTAIGGFRIDQAITLAAKPERADLQAALLPAAEAVVGLPSVVLSSDEVQSLRWGRSLQIGRRATSAAEIAAFDEKQNFVAILSPQAEGWFKPSKNFAQLLTE